MLSHIQETYFIYTFGISHDANPFALRDPAKKVFLGSEAPVSFYIPVFRRLLGELLKPP